MKTLKHKGRNAFIFVEDEHITLHVESHRHAGSITWQDNDIIHVIDEDIVNYEECDSTFALTQLHVILAAILGETTRTKSTNNEQTYQD